MAVVLDTCALLTFMNGERMRELAIRAIGAAQRSAIVWVPSIAAMEIARKVAAGRLQLSRGVSARVWFARALSEPGFEEFPLTSEIALAAYELPEPFHKDPADRLIIATARRLEAPHRHGRSADSRLRPTGPCRGDRVLKPSDRAHQRARCGGGGT